MKKLIPFLMILCWSFPVQAQWTQQAYYPGPIMNIRAINNQVAWATVFSSYGVIRTTNGGATWDTTSTVSKFSNIFVSVSLAALDADTAWYLAHGNNYNKLVYKTTNGGLTWAQQQLSSPSGYGFGIHFFDSQNGLILSNVPAGNWDFYTTANGGTTWMPVSMANLPPAHRTGHSMHNAFAVQGNTIWFTGKNLSNNMVLLKSTDRGLTWTSMLLPLASTPTRPHPETLVFRDQQNGLFTMDSLLYRTSDGGTNWQKVSYSGPLCNTNIIHVPGTDSTYLGVGSSAISSSVVRGSAVSKDDGNTWTLLDTDSHSGVSFISPTVGWAGGTNFLYKYNGNPLGLAKGKQMAVANPFTISPNPSTGIFTISGPANPAFRAEVYTITGMLVTQQHSRPFGPTRLNLTAQPKGLYLMKIFSQGQVFIRRVILN